MRAFNNRFINNRNTAEIVERLFRCGIFYFREYSGPEIGSGFIAFAESLRIKNGRVRGDKKTCRVRNVSRIRYEQVDRH